MTTDMTTDMTTPTAPLNTAAVARILDRQFPEIAPTQVAYLGAGEDSTAFEVNAKWVFRFPKRVEVERQLLVERAVLPVIAPRLPFAIPAFIYAGQPSPDYPFRFAGYEKLAGTLAIDVDPLAFPFDAIAASLGEFLTRLHQVPVSEAARLGARTERIEDYFEGVRASAVAELSLVQRVAPDFAIDRWRAYLTDLTPVATAPWPLTLTHRDFAAEHILVDTTTHQVTGVIDWGDVAVADPTIDFVGLFTWGGESFVRAVLESYAGPADERVVVRARPWAAFKAIQDIRYGVENNAPEYIRAGLRALNICAIPE